MVTGATGFIGSRVLPLLADHEVLCLSRDPGRVRTDHGRVRAAFADIMSGEDWIAEVDSFRPQWCLHLAWEGLPDYSPERSRANLDAGSRLLQVIARRGAERVVVAGSCWEYGRVNGATAESEGPREPGVFATSKLALLSAAKSLAAETGMEYRWARIFFAYGAGQKPASLIPHLRAAYRAGRQPEVREPATVQDFVHVDDVARALVALATTKADSGVYNVGTGTPTSVAKVANLVADHYGAEGSLEDTRGGGFWADTAKMKAATGWSSGIDIVTGVRQTLTEMDRAS